MTEPKDATWEQQLRETIERDEGDHLQLEPAQLDVHIQEEMGLAREELVLEGQAGAQVMFDVIWHRIVSLAGEEFRTKSGRPFKYKATSGYVQPLHTPRQLPRSQFAAVHDLGHLDGPGELARKDRRIQGPSYVWAILNDPRVRGSA